MALQRRGITIAIVAAAAALAATAIVLKWRDDRAFHNTALQLSRFPVEDAAVLSIDFAALRTGGLLSGPRGPLESEYREFLDGAGFDYRRDLDLVLASFSKSGNFFVVRGRFDWTKLSQYTMRHGGSCFHDLCRATGSTPERHISFLPLREDTMALAVSANDQAATRLIGTGDPVTGQLPSAPAWLSMPGAALLQPGAMPPRLRLMLSALTSADRIVLTVNTNAAGAVEAKLDAACRTQDDAGVLASQLRNTAGMVRDGLARKALEDDDFARALAAGAFDQSGTRVAGRWPLAKSLIESLTAGI